MSEDKNDDKKSASGRKPLTLKKTVGAGVVRQSFSHGRSKTVVVETKRKRMVGPGQSKAPGQSPEPEAPSHLSDEEMKARQRAIEAAKKAEAEATTKAEAEKAEAARRKAEEDAKKAEEAAAKAAAEKAAQAEAQKAEDKADDTAKDEPASPATALNPEDAPTRTQNMDGPRSAGRRLTRTGPKAEKKPEARKPDPQAPSPADVPPPPPAGGARPSKDARRDDFENDKRSAPKPSRKGGGKRREGRLTITSVLNDMEGNERSRSLASVKRAREKEREKRARMQGTGEAQHVSREVVIPEAITVQELANRMATRAAEVIKYMMKQGTMAKINDVIDPDTAELIAIEFGHTVKRVSESDVEEGFLDTAQDDPKDLKPRPPVVTIMGHVDHGKTSLLDALRETDVVAGEAGGITQHIGAYQVRLKDKSRITFLDTPGHAAFSAMRSRGAQATDIVILVVAADDGIMPQTIEAINHAKAAEVPMIVAVNKIDKEGADPNRVYTDLLNHEVIVESMGGEIQTVEVSALKKMNLDGLTDAITLQAELLELKANPDCRAEGMVIESQLDKGRGPVATLLVKRGTLKRGDIVVAGRQWGKVRALVDERNQQLKTAEPAQPVVILGLDGAPDPGEAFAVVESEARAREITEYRQRKKREQSAAPVAMGSLEQMMAKLKTDEIKDLALVVKADVQGSAEAIAGSIDKLGTDEVRGRIIHSAVGGVNESDVLLAKSAGAPIIAFNVRPMKGARDLADREGVEIRQYAVIYDLLDDIKAAMSGLLEPVIRETFLGNAEVLEVFNISKVGKVAGCRVTEGVVQRGARVRLLRDSVVIHDGKLSTLKRFKDEVAEVVTGQECGMGFENYHDLQPGDVIECFTEETVTRTLD